eukprot:g8294.t1
MLRHDAGVFDRSTRASPDGGRVVVGAAARRKRHAGAGVLRCSEVDAAPSPDRQSFKVVKAWRYEGSAVVVPWRALGDMLFEMGACSCSVSVEEHEATGEDPSAGEAAFASAEGEEDRDVTLTCIVAEAEGWENLGATLEAACELAGGPEGCFECLDWEEGPLECADHWEATRSSEGFDTIDMRRLQISPVQRDDKAPNPGVRQVKLLEGRGWGDGEHPSTWMCLDFLETAISGGEEVVDYGTGSGVLAAAAVLLGADHVVAIDIDFEVLIHARQNFLLNGVGDKVSALHGREVSIGDLSAEVVIANLMAGPMRRQMAALVLAVKAGGLLCLSGLRPSDTPLIRSDFGKYMDWEASLEATRKSSTWGEYIRIVGRPKPGLATGGPLRVELERELSDFAVA